MSSESKYNLDNIKKRVAHSGSTLQLTRLAGRQMPDTDTALIAHYQLEGREEDGDFHTAYLYFNGMGAVVIQDHFLNGYRLEEWNYETGYNQLDDLLQLKFNEENQDYPEMTDEEYSEFQAAIKWKEVNDIIS